MTMTTPTVGSPTSAAPMPWQASTVCALLQRMPHGRLDMQLPDGQRLQFGPGGTGPHGAMHVTDWHLFTAVMRSGDIGLAEGFIDGHWSTPDLTALLELMMRNRDALESLVYGNFWGRCLYRLRHLLNRNSRAGSRRNIHAHYDLGNPFYKLWLDESMSYSSAWWGCDPNADLIDAQRAKMGRVLSQAGVKAGARTLEIGCGWGSLATMAAGEHGAHVTGVTLSTEQLAHARSRIADAGLQAQVDLRLQDYRDIPEQGFDAIVSVEMFEAVGQAYWSSFFNTVRSKLAPHGRACIQTITIRDDLFDRYVSGTDFIQQYIFPGGLLPSAARFREQASRAGLVVVDEMAFGRDYARTLRLWRERFMAQEATVLQQGFDRRFLRVWHFYLAYCEAAFGTAQTDVVQFTLAHA